jgi:peroxiredoxin
LRAHHDDIRAAGGEVVAIGTGDARYAAAFVRDERIPFPVLVDDRAEAAHAAQVHTASWPGLFHPRTWRATVATWRRGHHIHRAGARVRQLGATFVVGPGDRVRYAHIDADSTDHAPVPEVLAALRDDHAP